MFFFNLIIKVYIVVLIFRKVFTNQELYFNPFGKLVASLTEPIFSNIFKGKSKVYTDRYIPLFIFFLIILQFLISLIFVSNSPLLTFTTVLQDNIDFLFIFFVLSILLGAGVGLSTYYTIYFYRIGLPWVKFVRRFIKLPDNRIVIPTILFMLILYWSLSFVLQVVSNKIVLDDYFLEVSAVSVLKGSVFILNSFLGFMFWLIVIRALISWVSPDPRNPIVQIIYSLTEPILAPFRKVIPPLGFIDLSAIVVLLVIEILRGLIFRFFA
ncbi:MAG: YggT family protein [Calditerrivibrio sp.]|nr:YggT family protein [Calditerrivibrio sp.]